MGEVNEALGGYDSAERVLEAVRAGAVVRREIVEFALHLIAGKRALDAFSALAASSTEATQSLEALGRAYAINFNSPAARAHLEDFDDESEI